MGAAIKVAVRKNADGSRKKKGLSLLGQEAKSYKMDDTKDTNRMSIRPFARCIMHMLWWMNDHSVEETFINWGVSWNLEDSIWKTCLFAWEDQMTETIVTKVPIDFKSKDHSQQHEQFIHMDEYKDAFSTGPKVILPSVFRAWLLDTETMTHCSSRYSHQLSHRFRRSVTSQSTLV